jgi:putative ABC transport system permease protein
MIWRLGWRNLWRDFRAGELRLLMLAVTLAVAAATAVGFFADRLQSGLKRDARQLLGGDAVLASDQPAPRALEALAQSMGLAVAHSMSFPTMARASADQGGGSRLVAMKAVEPGYPLRGQLQVSSLLAVDASTDSVTGIPQPGDVWVEPAVLEALGLKLGDNLLLGRMSFRIARLIYLESDRGAGFVNFSPRVMIHSADLSATGLIQPASRINYRLAVAAPTALSEQAAETAIQGFIQAAERLIAANDWRGLRVETIASGRPESSQTLERAEKFLNLVALLAVLLCAVAVVLAARNFAHTHLDNCAMLRVLGLSQAAMTGSYLVEFLWVGLMASLLGVGLGWAGHWAFVWLLSGLVKVALPAPSMWPAGLGLGMGLTLLLAFGLPPVLQLARVPALRVIRRDLGALKPQSAGMWLLGVLGFAGLLLAASTDLTLGLMLVGGFALAVLLMALVVWLVIGLLKYALHDTLAPRWLVLATRQFTARPLLAVVQVSSLGVGLLALMLLVVLRTDLVSAWQQATPADAPNRFVINIQPDQAEAFQQHLQQAGIARYDWFPMIRARLVTVNGQAIRPLDYTDDRAKRLVDREFNVSYSAQIPAHNSLIDGQWTTDDSNGISAESGLAKTLGLRLGDRVGFEVAGLWRESTITSVRKVDWTSLRVNFFMLYPVSQMPELPTTFITAFRTPSAQDGSGFDHLLVQKFPNLTVVDLGNTLLQVQTIMAQVIRAVEFLFMFTLAAGLVVLIAALTASREQRAREFAIFRALGASAHLMLKMQAAELAGVGLLAGTLAAALASAIGWALAHYVFEFEWVFSPLVLLGGSLSGALLALVTGWWSLRGVMQRPVAQTFRQAAA